MKTFKDIREDLASGRPIKKPVSSTLLKNIAKDNEVKSLKSLKMKEETFKPHDMWDDKGKKHFAKTEKEHLAMKDKGWGHENPNKSEEHAGDKCSCCDSTIKENGKCGCDSSCKQCGGTHNITELKTQTLSNYIRKSVSPLSKKSVGNLASKGAHKLAHSDDFDAGEKEDAKSFQRAKGVIRATKKIAKRAQANESSRDNYDPEIAIKRTKEKLKKAGLPPESPKVNGEPGEKVMEAKKPIVHSTKKDSLKMIKIKYNSPIKTKVTDIGAGGKEYVRKDWSEGNVTEYNTKDMKADEKEPNTLPKMDAAKRLAAMRADRQKPYKKPQHGVFSNHGRGAATSTIGEAYPKKLKNTGFKKTVSSGPLTKKEVKDGDILARQAREKADIKEEQKQLVTNLNQQEGVGAMVRRGLDKVRDSIKTAELNTGLKVDASKNKIGQNPLKDSQKKR